MRTAIALTTLLATLSASATAQQGGVDPRPPNAPTQKPASSGQTRAPEEALGVTFDVVTDLDTRVTTQLNTRRSAPFSIWVDRAGRITWEHEGFAPSEQQTITDGIAQLVG